MRPDWPIANAMAVAVAPYDGILKGGVHCSCIMPRAAVSQESNKVKSCLVPKAAQCWRPTCLDRRHDASLGATQTTRMGLPIRRAVVAEDIRHLQRRSHRTAQAGAGIESPVA